MNKITFPLNPNSQGSALTDLHDALRLFLERGIYPINEEERQFFVNLLREERAANRYSDITQKLVGMFQEIRHLPFSGNVDELTAGVMNDLLREWGLLEQGAATPLPVISGVIRRENGQPWPGLTVQVLQLVEQGAIRLGADTSDGEGRYTIRYQPLPSAGELLLQVVCLDGNGKRLAESERLPAPPPLAIVDLIAALPPAPVAPGQVSGQILLEYGLPADKLQVRLYSRGFGGQAIQLSETLTDDAGRYQLGHDLNNANLEVRAVVGEGEVVLSNTLFAAARETNLNLIAPGTVKPVEASEFARLSAALTTHLGDLSLLKSAEERGDRQDITYLSNAIAWDARPIALAALAGNLSEQVGITHEAAYALVRSGLPTALDQLVQVSNEEVAQALELAGKTGIVTLDEGQRNDALSQLATVAANKRLATKAVGALSTYGQFMRHAGLDETQQQHLADAYFSSRQTGVDLWTKAAAAGLPVARLKVQGKLAFLTGNNAELTQSLQQEIESEESLSRLVDTGLYDAESWRQRLHALAGVADDDDNAEALAALIPPTYPGATVAERKMAYCRDMAHKVEVAYPTQVQRHLLLNDKLALPADKVAIKADIDTVWQRAETLGFQLGAIQSESFFNRHWETLFAGISNETEQSTREVFTWFQRLYQTTPSRTAMQIVLKLGHQSANSIAEIAQDLFVERFVDEYLAQFKHASAEDARNLALLTYHKAQQVTATTHNVVAALKQMQSTPAVAAISGSAAEREQQQQAMQASLQEKLPGFPHLAELFGTLDFGECEHCHSVLSPAAYLVDLLQFLDRPEGEWRYFTDKWRKDHGEEYSATYSKPYEALTKRRPDLIHLPLTCENTHTALPYIDIVNEILEYYVAYEQLDQAVARDTGAATTPELLAEPQHVEAKAYTKLKEASYPLSLPFDLWLETVRHFCDHLAVPLWQVLATVQPVVDADLNTAFAQDRARWIEALGLSPVEAARLTDEDPLPKVAARYGFVDDAAMQAALTTAKGLAERLGVNYKELVALLRTYFINPKLDDLHLLHKLGVSVVDLLRFKGAADFAPLAQDEQDAFTARLTTLSATYGIDAVAETDALWAAGAPQQALLVNDSSAGSTFANATIGYAAGPAQPFDWLKLQLFVRLWRRLGWSIGEVDQALRVFLPANLQTIVHDPTLPETTRAQALGQALASALINLAHLQQLTAHLTVGKQARLKLTTFWAPIPTQGQQSLYAQLFLTRNVLKIDPIFDNALGRYLADPNVPLDDHLLAVQAALNLTAQEIALIVQDAEAQADTPLAKTPADPTKVALTLANVSLLYRYALLAKGLKLSVADLLTLKTLTGLQPFTLLATDAINDSAGDHFARQTLTFVTAAAQLQESGFPLDDLRYLFLHHFDPTGSYRTQITNAERLLDTLAQAIRQIQSDHAIPANPADPADLTPFAALTDEILQQKLALIAPPAAVEQFIAMWSARRPADWALVQSALSSFFTEELFNGLFVAAAPDADAQAQETHQLTRRAVFGRALLAHLQQSLIRQAIFRTLAETLAVEAGLVEWLLTDAAHLHLAPLPEQPLLAALQQAADPDQRETVLQAVLLLSKSVHLLQGLGLTQREMAYILDHGADFAGFALSKLPVTPPTDPTDPGHIANAQAGCQSLLRLLAYRQLKETLAGGSDALIELFTLATPATLERCHQRLAELTRREATVITAAVQLLALQPEHLGRTAGIAKVWRLLQLGQRLGVALPVLADLAQIVAGDLPAERYEQIAQGLKNAVKARYDIAGWQGVAQPIFDKVRQRKRDALVAYLLHQHRDRFRTVEEMYEYFLLDPGMEPVVQTSRIRLATASVQLFIQRCLLNLENRWEQQVPPAAINAKHWQWMNRYRVWEANRKIFLFPENWLEPEWRDDKSHLFQELEGKLLQGDVSADLVEEAFFVYLQKLETLARLEMVTMVCEEDDLNPQANKLHVIGRTYATPHQYFYRQYAQQMWTPWEPIDAEIDGDHLVATLWRGRLQLFWVTFLERMPQEIATSAGQSTPVTAAPLKAIKELAGLKQTLAIGNKSDTKLTDLSLADTKAYVATGAARKLMEAHLHWSEYYQGKWTTRQSSDLSSPLRQEVPLTTSQRDIFIHLSKEAQNPIDSKLDGAVLIHLNGLGKAFRVVNKNSPPQQVAAAAATQWPYATTNQVNRLQRTAGPFTVAFTSYLETLDGQVKQENKAPQTILGKSHGEIVLTPCSDPSSMGGAEVGKLVSPFFWQDGWHTFFVEPTLSETKTIKEWDEWVGGPPTLVKPFRPEVELIYPKPKLDDLERFGFDDRHVRYKPKVIQDWTTNPATLITYGDRVIDARGGLDVVVRSAAQVAPQRLHDGNQLNALLESGGHGQELLLVRPGSDSVVNAGVLHQEQGRNDLTRDAIALTPAVGVQLVGRAGVGAALRTGAGYLNEIFGNQLGGLGAGNLGGGIQ